MPDRIAAALDELAEAQHDLALSQHELALSLGSLGNDLWVQDRLRAGQEAARDRRRGRQFLAVGLVLVVILAGAIVNGVTLQLVRCALTPGCHIYDRNAAGQVAVVGSLTVEGDCRVRRADAGLPAPPDDRLPVERRRPCPAQTPTDVYPARTGDP